MVQLTQDPAHAVAARLAWLALGVLSFLAVAGWSDEPIPMRPADILNGGQRRAIAHLYQAALAMARSSQVVPALPEVRAELRSRLTGYDGQTVSRLRQLVAAKVIPTWPEASEVAVVPIEDLLEGELRDDVLDPMRCLIPVDQWPDAPPTSKVHASDSEWYDLCKEGCRRGIFCEVSEDQVFRDHRGNLVTMGAMGVDKIKDIEGQGRITLLRFICIMSPINAYMRQLRGDARHLPYVGHLTAMSVEDGHEIFVDGEDFTS